MNSLRITLARENCTSSDSIDTFGSVKAHPFVALASMAFQGDQDDVVHYVKVSGDKRLEKEKQCIPCLR